MNKKWIIIIAIVIIVIIAGIVIYNFMSNSDTLNNPPTINSSTQNQ